MRLKLNRHHYIDVVLMQGWPDIGVCLLACYALWICYWHGVFCNTPSGYVYWVFSSMGDAHRFVVAPLQGLGVLLSIHKNGMYYDCVLFIRIKSFGFELTIRMFSTMFSWFNLLNALKGQDITASGIARRLGWKIELTLKGWNTMPVQGLKSDMVD